jgi:exopolysaccharide production protein ExoY
LATVSVPRPVDSGSDFAWRLIGAGERVAGVVLFALILPVILVSALVIWISSRRSPWIAHRRVGWLGSDLWMLKLRTMWRPQSRGAGWIEYIEDSAGHAGKREGDPRVGNRFAAFCRRHSIDELPQLWHVITGEMSLVGPRPMTRSELRRYYGDDADEVLRVKPGLAGLWQVSGRNRLSYRERLRLDLRLVRERSAGLYFAVLWRTIPEVFRGENSW